MTAEAARDLAADEQVRGGCDLGGGGFAGADSPDWLVSDNDVFRVFRDDSDQGERNLLPQDFIRVVGFPLGQDFSDADNRGELVLERHGELFVEGFIGFVEVLALLRVPDDDMRRSDGRKHQCRGLAGIGALFGEVHVLGADADVGAGDGGDDCAQGCVGRAEDDLVPVMACDKGQEGFDVFFGLGRSFIHLPVGNYEWFVHCVLFMSPISIFPNVLQVLCESPSDEKDTTERDHRSWQAQSQKQESSYLFLIDTAIYWSAPPHQAASCLPKIPMKRRRRWRCG